MIGIADHNEYQFIICPQPSSSLDRLCFWSHLEYIYSTLISQYRRRGGAWNALNNLTRRYWEQRPQTSHRSDNSIIFLCISSTGFYRFRIPWFLVTLFGCYYAFFRHLWWWQIGSRYVICGIYSMNTNSFFVYALYECAYAVKMFFTSMGSKVLRRFIPLAFHP